VTTAKFMQFQLVGYLLQHDTIYIYSMRRDFRHPLLLLSLELFQCHSRYKLTVLDES